jgi:hypothetical protein
VPWQVAATAASNSSEGNLIWDAKSGGVLDVVIGPAGELASCGRDGQAKLWAADGKELKSFPIADAQAKASPA